MKRMELGKQSKILLLSNNSNISEESRIAIKHKYDHAGTFLSLKCY
jgi:hypothetical protein